MLVVRSLVTGCFMVAISTGKLLRLWHYHVRLVAIIHGLSVLSRGQ